MDKRLAGLKRLISSDPENPANYYMMAQALERINKSGDLKAPDFYIVFKMDFYPEDVEDEEERTRISTKPVGPFRSLEFKVRGRGKAFNSRTLIDRIKERDWTTIDPNTENINYELNITSRMEYGQPFEIAWIQSGIVYPMYEVYQAQFYQNFYIDHLNYEGKERIYINENNVRDFMENISFDSFQIFSTYESPEEVEKNLDENNSS